MGADRDDELARTATAPPSTSQPAAPATPIGPTLGRYRLERELGAGGMGVVHAAFDPDLERRIALKVLRVETHGDAHKRLLREARAMARLAHPNVITVHEVGSANGRDYVAMELVDGHTLAEWLRSGKRSEAEMIDAFVAAGRGLAAAHAAGIVHRDFKPHNVLRSGGGRIVVTDFGLAREAAADQEVTDPFAVTRPVDGETKAADSQASTLAGLTVAGQVLGTPAYMAPEQWGGGTVTHASDQFAFCVGLWEALAGERPFRGPTAEDLKTAIQRGPAELDASRIPRRLRRALRRGLDPDPAKRWPSMDALLAAIVRAQRRPVLALSIAGAALVAGAVGYVALGRGETHAPARCAAPALEPARVWSDGIASSLAARRPLEARALDADWKAWTAARATACGLAPATQSAELACLDGVEARFDVVARGVEALPRTADPYDPAALLIDPAVCTTARPPRLVATPSPQVREAIATMVRESATPGATDPSAMKTVLDRVKTDPCAAACARVLVAQATHASAERSQQLADAEQDAERCGDDRVRAEVALVVANQAFEGSFLGAGISSLLKSAEVAVERVAQPDLNAELDGLRAEVARRADNVDEAIARASAAQAGYLARGRFVASIEMGLSVIDMRDLRASPADLAEIPKLYSAWRGEAVQKLGEAHPLVHRIDEEIASRQLLTGDAAGAHARLEQLRRPVPTDRARKLTGQVVDDHGAPVAGATVVAGPRIEGDSVGVALALPGYAGQLRYATTDAAGAFQISDGPWDGVVIAQLGDRRSLAADIGDVDRGGSSPLLPPGVKLVVEPTSRIEGKVDLRGEPPTRVVVGIQDTRQPANSRYELIAPVKPDGSFVVDGVLRGRAHVFAGLRRIATRAFNSITIDVTQPVVRGVQLSVATTRRVVHVVVRNTVGMPVANAQVFALAGQHPSMTAREMVGIMSNANIALARQIEGEHAPPAVVGVARAGDMFATMTEVPEGVASACAVGLPPDLSDSDLDAKVKRNLDKIEVRCTPIPAGATVVVVEVPPWPRLD